MEKHNLLYPQIPAIDKKKKDLTIYISGYSQESQNVIYTVGTNVQKIVADVANSSYSIENLPKFLETLPRISRLKAVILSVFELERPEFRNNNSEFCHMISKTLRKLQIPFKFFNWFTYSSMESLIAAKIQPKIKNIILTIVVDVDSIDVVELLRNEKEYIVQNRQLIKYDLKNKNENYEKIKLQIFGPSSSSNPKIIIICKAGDISLEGDFAMAIIKKKVLDGKKIIYLDDESIFKEAAAAIARNIYDKNFNEVYIAPSCNDIFGIAADKADLNDPNNILISTKLYEKLPLEKNCIIPKSKKLFKVVRFNDKSKKWQITRNFEPFENHPCHRMKLSLIVDENNLPFLYQEPFIMPEIQLMPEKLKAKSNLGEIPVIGLFDNSSVICIPGENGYEFMESWNGMHGKELFLSFQHEKPMIVSDISDPEIKITSVVYDLIKILSMSAENLKINPEWKFTVIKNKETASIMLEIDNYDGTRQTGSPPFMMALILKQHIKAVREKIGKLPKKFGFCFFNNFSDEEKANVEKGLKEASKLMNIEFQNVELH